MTTTTLISIAQRAIELYHAHEEAAHAKVDLQEGYAEWRNEHGFDFIQRDSEEWEAMLQYTSGQYAFFQQKRADESAAKRRLKSAIKLHLKSENSPKGKKLTVVRGDAQ